ncbi:helix-turn-helix domain-containing protein [Streptomyces sp. SL13]|jgi:DNA-binding HxlR family transcriptional regulator|uniref:Helix-turn-helix domain-containing protein n=1 Tax=Streptantibioticus silvisoli TaxID=2705255 RepID=A0AA90H7U5_9ACTN|nr:helix-turn-helix domain-containing protein [Streptantibioticus silvisoli]MDI5965574.1 helix-turn-helix domain-containing protein [Streptantibioticus silvisoli]MDI5972595.1 helix-turn-helix domain-containing protein [Streptantibioticus silvisoli]
MPTGRGTAHEPRKCDAALSRAFRFLGKRWNGVLLGTLMAGPASFSEIKRALAGINDSVLSERLSELAAAGLLVRSVIEGPPVAVSYALTPVGQELFPALEALTSWAERNLMDDGPCAGKV